MAYSDHVIYVDESGDHSLTSIDPSYPIFVLAFCVFRKDDYCRHVVPAVHDLKFRWFGHDSIILHEHEIRRADPPFVFLGDPVKRRFFMEHLTAIVAAAPMTVVASVIHKERLAKRYHTPHSPYELALLFCMERAREYLDEVAGDPHGTTHIVCEARGGSGGKEDRELEQEFRRISRGEIRRLPGRAVEGFDIVFVDKKANSPGLQIADLIARPIGVASLKPEQTNRAYDVIAPKIWDRKTFP
jgi:hypothetical protein